MDEFTIEAEDLHKAFGPVTALGGLTLRVKTGSVLGLLGPNGSGKTTTVSILSTALRPDRGHALVHGLDVVSDAARVRELIGFAGQYAAVDPSLTGRENLALIGRLSRVGRRRALTRAGQLLDIFGLANAADRLVRGYSGGMRRRLDLAAALVHQPPVLFLDEPTTGLDPESRFQLWDVVRDLSRAGTTVLLTTQYLEEADALADQVVITAGGRAVGTGTPAQLKERLGTVVITLGFAAPGDALAAARLLAQAGYQAEADGARLHIRSGTGSGALPCLLRTLGGMPDPVSVAIREPTLDDVFLTLTAQAPSSPGGTLA